jgi:hypothetical protein
MAQKLLNYDDVIDTAKKKVILDKIAPKLPAPINQAPTLPGASFQRKPGTPLADSTYHSPLDYAEFLKTQYGREETPVTPLPMEYNDTMTGADAKGTFNIGGDEVNTDAVKETLRRIEINQDEHAKQNFTQNKNAYNKYVTNNNLLPLTSTEEALKMWTNPFVPAPEKIMGVEKYPQLLVHTGEESLRQIIDTVGRVMPQTVLQLPNMKTERAMPTYDKTTGGAITVGSWIGNQFIKLLPKDMEDWLRNEVMTIPGEYEAKMKEDSATYARDKLERFRAEFGNAKVDGIMDIVQKTVGSTIDQAPQIALSFLLNPAAGMTYLFASAATRQYDSLITQGYSPDVAGAGALVSGGLEVATEKLFGGIPGLGKGVLSKGVTQAIQDTISRVVKTGYTNATLAKVVDIWGEGVEEYLATAFGDALFKMTQGKPASEVLTQFWSDATSRQAQEDFVIGMLSSLLLESGEMAVGRGLMKLKQQTLLTQMTIEQQFTVAGLISKALGNETIVAGLDTQGNITEDVTQVNPNVEGYASVPDTTGASTVVINPYATQGEQNIKGEQARAPIQVAVHENLGHTTQYVRDAINDLGEVLSVESQEYKELVDMFVGYMIDGDLYQAEAARIAQDYGAKVRNADGTINEKVLNLEMFTQFVEKKVLTNYEMLLRAFRVAPSIIQTLKYNLAKFGTGLAGTPEGQLIQQIETVMEHVIQTKMDAVMMSEIAFNRHTAESATVEISNMGRTLYKTLYPEKAAKLEIKEKKLVAKRATPKAEPVIRVQGLSFAGGKYSVSVNGQDFKPANPEIYHDVDAVSLPRAVVQKHAPELHDKIHGYTASLNIRAAVELIVLHPKALNEAQQEATDLLVEAGVETAEAKKLVATTFAENAHKRSTGDIDYYNTNAINHALWQRAAAALLKKTDNDVAVSHDGKKVLGVTGMMFSIQAKDAAGAELSEEQKAYFNFSQVVDKDRRLIPMNAGWGDYAKDKETVNRLSVYDEVFGGTPFFPAGANVTGSSRFLDVKTTLSATHKMVTLEHAIAALEETFEGYDPADYDYMFSEDVLGTNYEYTQDLPKAITQLTRIYKETTNDIDFIKRVAMNDGRELRTKYTWYNLMRYYVDNMMIKAGIDGYIVRDENLDIEYVFLSDEATSASVDNRTLETRFGTMLSINNTEGSIPKVYEEATEPEEVYVKRIDSILMPGFKSGLVKLVLDKMQSRIIVKDAMLIAKTANKDEYEWTGLQEYLEGLAPDLKISRATILKVIADNYPSFAVIEKSQGFSYSGYARTTKAGLQPQQAHYREYLFIFKSSPFGNYSPPHFGSEPNMMMHIRSYMMYDENGVLQQFIDEIQSDWHQKGRKSGYQDSAEVKVLNAKLLQQNQVVTNIRQAAANVLGDFAKKAFPLRTFMYEVPVNANGELLPGRIVREPTAQEVKQGQQRHDERMKDYLERYQMDDKFFVTSHDGNYTEDGKLTRLVGYALLKATDGGEGVRDSGVFYRKDFQKDTGKYIIQFKFDTYQRMSEYFMRLAAIDKVMQSVESLQAFRMIAEYATEYYPEKSTLADDVAAMRRDFADAIDKLEHIRESMNQKRQGVPNAPFKANWIDLAARVMTNIYAREGAKRIYLTDDMLHIDRWGRIPDVDNTAKVSRYTWGSNGLSEITLAVQRYTLRHDVDGKSIEDGLNANKQTFQLRNYVQQDGAIMQLKDAVALLGDQLDANQIVDMEDMRVILTDLYKTMFDITGYNEVENIKTKEKEKQPIYAFKPGFEGNMSTGSVTIDYGRFRAFKVDRAFGFAKFYGEKLPSVMSKVFKKYGVSMQEGYLSAKNYAESFNNTRRHMTEREYLKGFSDRYLHSLALSVNIKGILRNYLSYVDECIEYGRMPASFYTYTRATSSTYLGYYKELKQLVANEGVYNEGENAHEVDANEYSQWLFENDESLVDLFGKNIFQEYYESNRVKSISEIIDQSPGSPEGKNAWQQRKAYGNHYDGVPVLYKYFEIDDATRSKIVGDGQNMFSITENYEEELTSALQNRLEQNLNKQTPAKVVLGIVNKGKAEEAYWSGMKQWLEALPPNQLVSKEEVMEHFEQGKIRIRKVVLSDNEALGNRPQYTRYALGTNQREMVYQGFSEALTEHLAPSYHWENRKNVMLHVRISDLAPGHLLVDEIQSDVHQLATKRKGYAETDAQKAIVDRHREGMDNRRQQAFDELFDYYRNQHGYLGEMKVRLKVDGMTTPFFGKDIDQAVKSYHMHVLKAADRVSNFKATNTNQAIDEGQVHDLVINVANGITGFDKPVKAKAQVFASQQALSATIALGIEGYDPINDRSLVAQNGGTRSQAYLNWYMEMVKLYKAMNNKNTKDVAVPGDTTNYRPMELPYRKDTWWDFGFREVMKTAATEGYKRVYLTRGIIQALRYDDGSTQNVRAVLFFQDNGVPTMTIYNGSGMGTTTNTVSFFENYWKSDANPLRALLNANEHAQVEAWQKNGGKLFLRLDDGRIINNFYPGMRKFYDEKIPSYINDFLKMYNQELQYDRYNTDKIVKDIDNGIARLRLLASDAFAELSTYTIDQSIKDEMRDLNNEIASQNSTYYADFRIWSERLLAVMDIVRQAPTHATRAAYWDIARGDIAANLTFTTKAMNGYVDKMGKGDFLYENSMLGEMGTKNYLERSFLLPYFEVTDKMVEDIKQNGTAMFSIQAEDSEPGLYTSPIYGAVDMLPSRFRVKDLIDALDGQSITMSEALAHGLHPYYDGTLDDNAYVTKSKLLEILNANKLTVKVEQKTPRLSGQTVWLGFQAAPLSEYFDIYNHKYLNHNDRRISRVYVTGNQITPPVSDIDSSYMMETLPEASVQYVPTKDGKTLLVETIHTFEGDEREMYDSDAHEQFKAGMKELVAANEEMIDVYLEAVKNKFNIRQAEQVNYVAVDTGNVRWANIPLTDINSDTLKQRIRDGLVAALGGDGLGNIVMEELTGQEGVLRFRIKNYNGTSNGIDMTIYPTGGDRAYGSMLLRNGYDYYSYTNKPDGMRNIISEIRAKRDKIVEKMTNNWNYYPEAESPLLSSRRILLGVKEAIRVAVNQGRSYVAFTPLMAWAMYYGGVSIAKDAKVQWTNRKDRPKVVYFPNANNWHTTEIKNIAEYDKMVAFREKFYDGFDATTVTDLETRSRMYLDLFMYGLEENYGVGQKYLKYREPVLTLPSRNNYPEVFRGFEDMEDAAHEMAALYGLPMKKGLMDINGIREISPADEKRTIIETAGDFINNHSGVVLNYMELTPEIIEQVKNEGQNLFSISGKYTDSENNPIDDRIFERVKNNDRRTQENKNIVVDGVSMRRPKLYYHGSPNNAGDAMRTNSRFWRDMFERSPYLKDIPGISGVHFFTDSFETAATYTQTYDGKNMTYKKNSNFPYASADVFIDAALKLGRSDVKVIQAHHYQKTRYNTYKQALAAVARDGGVASDITSYYRTVFGNKTTDYTKAADLLTHGVYAYRKYTGQDLQGIQQGLVEVKNAVGLNAQGREFNKLRTGKQNAQHIDDIIAETLEKEYVKWKKEGDKYVPLDAFIVDNVIDAKYSFGYALPSQTLVLFNDKNWITDAKVAKLDEDKLFSIRSWEQTASESGQLRPIVENDIKNAIAMGDFDYVPHTDKKAWMTAGARIMGQSTTLTKEVLDGAFQNFMELMDSGKRLNKDDIAIGERLIVAYSQTEHADSNKVMQLISSVAVLGTELGQQVQALGMISKLSPEGQLMYIMRAVHRMEGMYTAEHGGMLKIEINAELVDELMRQNNGEGITIVIDKIKQDIANQMPVNWVQKLDAWRYLAMLGNPKTHIRNIMGNAFFVPLAVSKDVIATMIETGMGVKQSERTHAILNPFSAADNELLKFAREHWQENQNSIMASGKYDFQSDIRFKQKVFGNRFLEWLRDVNFAALDGEDQLFLHMAFTRNLAQFMKARKWTASDITKRQLQEAENYAIDEAKKLTFRDASHLANTLNYLERTSGALGWFIKAVAPFKKTPANIMKRGVEYSPLAIMTTIPKQMYKLKRGESTISQVVDAIASGLTGTGIMLLGMFLYGAGVLNVDEDEKDRLTSYNQNRGEQRFSMQFPDGGNYTIDWIVPAVMPLFIGAQLAAYWKKRNVNPLYFAPEAMIKVFDPVFELTMLQGITDTIQSFSQSGAAMVGEAMTTAGSNLVGQFFPTLGGQIARIIDPIRRSTRAEKDSEVTPFLETLVRKLMNKIPGASQFNEPMVDSRGEELVQPGDTFTRIISNMVSPGYYAKIKNSPQDVEIQRLFNLTQDTAVLPRTPASAFTNEGVEYILDNEESTLLAKTLGKTSYDVVDRLMNAGYYKKAPLETQSKLIKDAYDYAYYKAKDAVLAGRNVAVTDKWYLKIKEAGKAGISAVDYLIAKSTYDTLVYDEMYTTKKDAYAELLVNSGYNLEKIKHLMIAVGNYTINDEYAWYLEYLLIMK